MTVEDAAGVSAASTSRGTQAGPVGDDVVMRTRGLTKYFRGAGIDVRALHGVDLDVACAQMLVLLGPSGCGKTTLLRCIGGLENPTAGQVELAGRLVTSVTDGINLPPERRNLGMMFQSFGLWPHMTVFENVAYPLQNRRGLTRLDIRARVVAMLETMGIETLIERYPGQLSGGEQQRVALARALVGDPIALLFDEPLSNVDAQVRKRLREEIRQMKSERGFAGVYVTHDQEEAMALADVLAVMQEGEIRQIGSPWEVYRRPRSLYVAHFVGEANTLPARVVGFDAHHLAVDTEIGRVTIDNMAPMPALGATGHLMLRPENLKISAMRADCRERPNVFHGHVIQTILLGARTELQVTVGTAQLRVCTDSVAASAFAPQDHVVLEIMPASAAWIA